jgi:ubiquinol-cytochrome c reductase cytochrome c subunit
VLEAYIALVAPGGPPIPEIATSGNLEHGRVLFTQNCQHCHGVDAGGASIGDSAEWAPSLHAASITQVAEAVRVGPGYMPKFAPSQLDDPALGDLATYVISLDTAAATGAFPLNSGGPVPEGLYGWLAAGFLALLGYTFSKRSGRTPVDDSEPGEERE